MSQQQRAALDAMLRAAPLDLGGDVQQQREIFEDMMQQTPAPEDVAATAGTLGGVPVVHIDVLGATQRTSSSTSTVAPMPLARPTRPWR